MPAYVSVVTFRVRYSETDQMGTFYNSRVLEWFECGRTEYLREIGLPYSAIEQRGLGLPLVEAKVKYLGRAAYDDLLRMRCSGCLSGRARVRFDLEIEHNDGRAVASGCTIHAITNRHGKAVRPPLWLKEVIDRVQES
ncbi:MAG: acyl-CoA thioesterase [Sedimentisphaerales bacterium]|nr:acyl-CoA thioesterase [Sedimentisphaerales bacterium]